MIQEEPARSSSSYFTGCSETKAMWMAGEIAHQCVLQEITQRISSIAILWLRLRQR